MHHIRLVPEVTSAVDLVRQYPRETEELLAACHRFYTRAALGISDHLTRRWLRRNAVPYADEIHAIDDLLQQKGPLTLNLSYEWGCTTMSRSVADEGVQMLRALDWPIPGMAHLVMVVQQSGQAGPYWNITWPGFVGVLNAMAPQRFAAAINQAPLPNYRLGKLGNWALTRFKTGRSRGIPAPYLLRQVFEECETYENAKERLTTTPLCIPAIFTLAGTQAGQSCIIERFYDQAVVHEDKACVGNHWLNSAWQGKPRPYYSHERVATGTQALPTYKGNFDWLTFPILNAHTRLAFEANALTGTLNVVAYEGDRRVTEILRVGRVG